MWPAFACPEGAPSCNDTTATSALLLLFPVAVLCAYVIARLLARFVARRRRLGFAIALLGAVLFIDYAGGPSFGTVVAFALGVIGLVFALGQRVDTRTALA